MRVLGIILTALGLGILSLMAGAAQAAWVYAHSHRYLMPWETYGGLFALCVLLSAIVIGALGFVFYGVRCAIRGDL